MFTLNQERNKNVWGGKFLFEKLTFVNFMDKNIRYSTSYDYGPLRMTNMIYIGEKIWVELILHPTFIVANKAFQKKIFRDNLSDLDVPFKLVPQGFNHGSKIKSKHGILSSILSHPVVVEDRRLFERKLQTKQ